MWALLSVRQNRQDLLNMGRGAATAAVLGSKGRGLVAFPTRGCDSEEQITLSATLAALGSIAEGDVWKEH